MKQYGYNRFECCGRKLVTRYNHCPECGEKIPRPEPSDATSILMRLDTDARRAESAAQWNTDKGNEAEYAEEHSECCHDERCHNWPKECPKCAAREDKKTRFKAAATHTKNALWHRSVEKLIRDLLSNIIMQ
jgi:hypothetical protein